MTRIYTLMISISVECAKIDGNYNFIIPITPIMNLALSKKVPKDNFEVI